MTMTVVKMVKRIDTTGLHNHTVAIQYCTVALHHHIVDHHHRTSPSYCRASCFFVLRENTLAQRQNHTWSELHISVCKSHILFLRCLVLCGNFGYKFSFFKFIFLSTCNFKTSTLKPYCGHRVTHLKVILMIIDFL